MSAFLSAVVPAAGASRRMGFDKLLTEISGVSLLEYTLQRLLQSPQIGELIVVVAPDSEKSVRLIIDKLKESRPIKIVHGGAERQDSVLAGLLATDPATEYVMIHDAARPFVTPQLIELVAKAAQENGAAVCGQPSTDTLKEAAPNGMIAGTLDRGKIWAVQTPQVFQRTLIIDAYQQVIKAGKTVTDDTAAVSALGKPVKLVLNEEINLKVTRPIDWTIASYILAALDEDVAMLSMMRKLIHDISNQITSVMGFSFLLDMDVPEDSPLKSHVTSLNDSSNKCLGIVGEMQSLAREMQGKKIAMHKKMGGSQAPATPFGH